VNVEDTNTTPAYADVEASHQLTAEERVELDALAKEEQGEAAAKAAADAAEKDKVDAEAQAAVDAAAKAEADKARAEAEAKAAADAQAAAVAAKPALRDVPTPPKDFDKERADLKSKYEDGDLTADEYADAREKLADERAEWIAAKTLAETHNASVIAAAESTAVQSFNDAAAAWAAQHAEFMANPLRKKAMQDAINEVDTATGGTLAPTKLLEEAAKIAFEAYGYTPPKPTSKADALAAAAKTRKPQTDLPTNLGGAPNAGIERGVSAFADLDAGSVVDMENAIAGMSADEREKFLLEVDPD